jgi:hypothetical protein
MNADLELDGWRRRWQAQPARFDVVALKESVARETRRMKVMLLAPVGVTVGIGGWALIGALTRPTAASLSLAIGVWSFIVMAWAGALWLSRGTWRPQAETTDAFVEVAIRRCESAVQSVPLALALYVLQIVFMLLWAPRMLHVEPAQVLLAPQMVLMGWIGLPVFTGFMIWYARRKRAELASLQAVRRQLSRD